MRLPPEAAKCEETARDGAEEVSQANRRASDRLLGRSEEPPRIQVIDVDNKKRPW